MHGEKIKVIILVNKQTDAQFFLYVFISILKSRFVCIEINIFKEEPASSWLFTRIIPRRRSTEHKIIKLFPSKLKQKK